MEKKINETKFFFLLKKQKNQCFYFSFSFSFFLFFKTFSRKLKKCDIQISQVLLSMMNRKCIITTTMTIMITVFMKLTQKKEIPKA